MIEVIALSSFLVPLLGVFSKKVGDKSGDEITNARTLYHAHPLQVTEKQYARIKLLVGERKNRTIGLVQTVLL